MIAHLSGTLLAKHATSVILEVGGVGYEVTIPVTTFYDMEEAGSQVSLRIYTHVREEALQLYGFKTARERELFTQLDDEPLGGLLAESGDRGQPREVVRADRRDDLVGAHPREHRDG